MTDFKCPFCGSTQRRVKTPYVDKFTGRPQTTYCCDAQKKNAKYEKKFLYGTEPEEEEISKW